MQEHYIRSLRATTINHLPRHPAGIVARQKSGGQGDVIRLRDPTQRCGFSCCSLARLAFAAAMSSLATEH